MAAVAGARAPICTWGCLGPLLTSSSSSTKSAPSSSLKKSFAQALNNSFDIPLSELPKPCRKGESLSIKISEEEYRAGVVDCLKILHGHLFLSKGDTPLRVDALRAKLSRLWKTSGSWSLVSLGKGFYEFNFASATDQRSIRSIGAWNLDPGVLRMSAWSPDFNPHIMKQTHSQVWVHTHGLAREYWRPRILFEIGGGIETPIALNEATRKRSFGHFARLLIEVDLNDNLVDHLMVEREGCEFYVDVEYEKLPAFCTLCQNIGHSNANCKKTHAPPSKLENAVLQKKMGMPKEVRKPQLEYVPKKATHVATATRDVAVIDKGKEVVVVELERNEVDKDAYDAHVLDNQNKVTLVSIVNVPAFKGINNVHLSEQNLIDNDKGAVPSKEAAFNPNHEVFGSADSSTSFVADSVLGTNQEEINPLCANDIESTQVIETVNKAIHDVFGSPSNTEDSAHAADSQLVASACQFSPLNITPVIVKDLSSFPTTVQNDFKILSYYWAKQKGASTSKEDEQNNDNVNNDNAADDSFMMVKFKVQKRYHLRLNRKSNSKFT